MDGLTETPMQPAAEPSATAIQREPVDNGESDAKLVEEIIAGVKRAKKKWADDFAAMRDDMRFALGLQWDGQTELRKEKRVVINLVQRHLQQQTAALYAKNPKAAAYRRKRLDFAIWDGTPESVMAAQQDAAVKAPAYDAAVQAATLQGTPAPAPPASLALLQDLQQGMLYRKQIAGLAQTLEILFEYSIGEQQSPAFKRRAKRLVRRTKTCGVGYIEIDYQRAFGKRPDTVAKLDDYTQRLAKIEQLRADIADGEVDPAASQVAELQAAITALQAEPEIVLREGLVFDFPKATSVIPDEFCTSLDGFEGCKRVAKEILMTPDDVKATYGADVGKNFQKHSISQAGQMEMRFENETPRYGDMVCVWEVYDRSTGLKYVVADGHKNFLKAPAAPEVTVEGLVPIFALMFNELETEAGVISPFPPSDVTLLRSLQKEFNRTRESLRQHRYASRPLYGAAPGNFDEGEQHNMATHAAHDVIVLKTLAGGGKVDDILQQIKKAPIDPNVYEVQGLYDDMNRTVGTQEANLGGTSNATATESSIAESSRMASLSSNVDDLDDCFSAVFRAAGQVLLANMPREQVVKIVGPGAVWVELSRQEIAEEVFLQVEAGSSGRPSKAQDLANFERIAPFMLQMPGVNPSWLTRYIIKILDDRVDPVDAILEGMPSITQLNAAKQPGTGDPATDPNAQGEKGGDNQKKSQQTDNNQRAGFPAGNVIRYDARGNRMAA